MNRKNIQWLLAVTGVLIILTPWVYFVNRYAGTLNGFEKAASIFYPVVLGLAFFWLANWSNGRALTRERRHVTNVLQSFTNDITAQRVKVYPTKKGVPGGSQFWNDLAKDTSNRLFIVGTTNKSWFNKDEAQSQQLAGDFCRIRRNGGDVVVVSINNADNKKMMKDFVRNHGNEFIHLNQGTFRFATVRKLTYGAILTDRKIVLMPLPHADKFREETMVLEISQDETPDIFQNYQSDIERLVAGANETDLVP